MRRDLAALSNQSFDLLVIGGGIHGACVAWEATLRGLSVALVEQSDFASGTSANSLKVIHGGLRYLQTADFKRMRQSIRERQTLMRIAPHLVHPLPVLVPTYGHGIKGKEAMTVALKLNDWISCDRNLPLTDPQKHIPPSQILSKQACLQALPDIPTAGLTGAARFYDAQVYNSEQLVLAFLQSAAQRGAQLANYTRAVEFIKEDERVVGIVAQDQLAGNRFPIQATTTINASGPWLNQLMEIAAGSGPASGSTSNPNATPSQTLAKAMNLVTRPLFSPHQTCAIGITGRAPGSRLFFIAPWRNQSLVGTWYGPNHAGTHPPAATSAEVESFLQEINQAYPTFNLTKDDVKWVHSGLLPSDGRSATTGDMKLTKHFQLTDHRVDGLKGLLSIVGVKYTTARDLARRAVDWVFRDRGAFSPPSTSHKEALYGGRIERFQQFMDDAIQAHTTTLSTETVKRLVYNYGSAYPDVLRYASPAAEHGISEPSEFNVLAAEVRYSLQATMAQTLSDIIFRRTELGAAGHPGDQALYLCAQVMGKQLGWSPQKQQSEIEKVQQRFQHYPPKESQTHLQNPSSTSSFMASEAIAGIEQQQSEAQPPCPV